MLPGNNGRIQNRVAMPFKVQIFTFLIQMTGPFKVIGPFASITKNPTPSFARQPGCGSIKEFQTDSNWCDHIPIHKYYHACNGEGLGASLQPGWTGVIAKITQLFGALNPVKSWKQVK